MTFYWKLKDEELKRILHRSYNPDNEEQSVTKAKSELIPHLKNNPCWHGLSTTVFKRLDDAKTFHTFNQVLDEVFDFADEHRIWLGFMPID